MNPLSKNIMEPKFDIARTNLIEASAGTGKTYSIQTLFLRLVVIEGISVQEILVVTFTEAATKELRERLRDILEKSKLSIDENSTLSDDDPDKDRINSILDLEVKNVPATYSDKDKHNIHNRRIKRALLDFDQAAVYTIHGFCQRTLQEFAFECGHDFDTEVINGENLLRQLCTDWWRQINYSNPTGVTEGIFKEDSPSINRLTELVKAVAMRPMAEILPSHENISEQLSKGISGCIEILKHSLKTVKAEVKNSAYYFLDDEATAVCDLLDKLADSSEPDSYESFEIIRKLHAEINAGDKRNNYEAPLEIKECIDACKTHQALKSGTEKDEAREYASELISRNYDAMKKFLEEDNIFYTKNDFDDLSKRATHLEILKSQEPVAKLKQAFTQIYKLKIRAKTPWYCSAVTETFRDEIKKTAGAENDIILNVEVKGEKAVLEKYNQAKRDAYEMTFDDMIQRLQETLSSNEATPLHKALREKYKVALIDEFQDTDAVQYAIFYEIFAKGEKTLFYVGDPKQAIYSFRGGDIFTYAAAVDSVDNDKKYSLDTNYRSQNTLIDAINTIFMDRSIETEASKSDSDGDPNNGGKNISSLFGSDKITYSDRLKCNGLKTDFIDEGTKDESPFKIWKYSKETDKKITSHTSSEAMVIYSDVANEVVRLLNSKNSGFMAEGEPLQRVMPSDIAILVKRHAEASYIYRALRKRGVPVVRQSNDNVFDSEEAMNLLYLLKAMANPENISTVRTALSSSLMPVTDKEIEVLSRDEIISNLGATNLGAKDLPDSMENWIVLFKDIKDLWQRKNFSTAFSRLARETSINANLASQPMGERKIVNIKQLHDLIHQVSTERHFGRESLIKWFANQINNETREENDAFETRLESDADAVQIMTIFKSKGLEFPIVFVPTMWTNIVGQSNQQYKVYHDDLAQTDIKTIIHFDAKDVTANEKAKMEKDQEEVRSLYVAVTRSSHRTYIAAGDLGKQDSIQAKCIPIDLIDIWGKDAQTGIEVRDKCFHFNRASTIDGSNAFSDIELSVEEAAVDISRGHTSFSSISPHGYSSSTTTDDSKDFDANTAKQEQSSKENTDSTNSLSELNIFSFPAGAHTGTCWHNIFELLDFKSSETEMKNIINTQLSLSRLDKGDQNRANIKRELTYTMVKNVLEANLHVEGVDEFVKLSEVSENEKLAEMDFDFSLNANSGDGERNAIFKVLNEEWKDAKENSDGKIFLDRLQNWKTRIPSGFMTGSVDLLFKQNGKYYILDWKSNSLNQEPKGFHRPGLVTEMATHSYFLQYLIYTVAVHRYLGQCLGDKYNYDKHFGGALYIFLRGVDQSKDKESQNGIFYTKPKKELIEKLAGALMGNHDDFR